MAIKTINSYFKGYENGTPIERVEIAVDSAEELPENLDGTIMAMGSIAWDVSTGDFYGLGSDGTWKKQNSGGGSGTVEYFEVDITLDIEQNISISSGYDEIKSAIDNGKIINGTFTYDLSAASMENVESGIVGGFGENPTRLSEDGCIVLYSYPFTIEDMTVCVACIITPEDLVYVGSIGQWGSVTPTRGGGNKIDLSNTPFAKFINSIKEEEKK